MAQPERTSSPENQSIWRSRLFKFGVITAIVGAAFTAPELIVVGVVTTGAAWALWSKENH